MARFAAMARGAGEPALLRVQLAWAAVITASWASTVSLAVVAYAEGGSAAVGLAVLARTIPGLLVGPAVGGLVDRLSRTRAMTGAAALCAVATAAAAAAGEALVLVVVLMAVVAVATTVFRAAQSAVLPELVRDPGQLTTANVLASAVEAIGIFAGPALAGGLLALSGPRLSFGTAAALFACATAVLVTLVGRPPAAPAPDAERASTRAMLQVRPARLLLALLFAQTVVAGSLLVLYAALAVEELRASDAAVGLLTSSFGVGGVLGSIGLFALAGSSRLGLFTAWAMLAWGLPLVLIVPAPGLAAVAALLAVAGAANVLFDVTTVTLMQRAVPDHLLSRAFGLLETLIVAGYGVGALAAPLLERLVGVAGALALLGGLLALLGLVTLPALRRLDRDVAAPVRQVALLRGVPAFALLPTPELERLALRLRRRELAGGEVVARQGEPGRTWFLVDDGELSVAVDGRRVTELRSGDAFGEIALLREGVRTATVTALTPSTVWALDGTVFVAALRADGGRSLDAADAVVQAHLRRAAPAAERP